MAKDNSDFCGGIFWGIIIGMTIGMIVIGLVSSNWGFAVVEVDFIDNVCNQTYGEGYFYEDGRFFGVDEVITCINLIELNQEEEWINKK